MTGVARNRIHWLMPCAVVGALFWATLPTTRGIGCKK